MSSADSARVELLLRRALAPVEPPEDLAERLESTLQNITDLAAEELEGWELTAMGDPRNWVRPAVALAAGTTAGVALVLMRARQRSRTQPPSSMADLRDLANQTAQDLADQTRRLLDSH